MNALIVIFFLTYGVYSFFNNIRFLLIYLALLLVYYYITQIKMFKSSFDSMRRKISIATWHASYDPQTYSKLKLDITKIEPYLSKKSEETGEKLTLTIFCIKLIALVLKRYPEVYGCIKFGRYIQKENVDMCCLVQVGDGEDLANHTVCRAEEKSLEEISSELKQSVIKLRNKKSKEHNQKLNVVKFLPTFLLGPIAQMLSYLSSIGIEIKSLGMRKNEFGSCVLTSVGSLGIQDGYAPIPPLSFVPLLITLCQKKTKYYYDESKKIQEKVVLGVNVTIDQRFVDPILARNMIRDFKLFGEDPEMFETEMLRLSPKNATDKKNI